MNTVLITGASSGIGNAAVRLFAARGWNVIAGMRNPGTANEFQEIENILVTRLDVNDQDSIRYAVSKGVLQFGSVDVLVNSAGYGLMGVFEAVSLEQIKRQYEVNVFGLMSATQAVLPQMREQGMGCIINLSSFGGVVGLPFGSLYNSSKFAVEGFSEALAHELAPLNIRVKIVEPGSIETSFRQNIEMIDNQIAAYKPLIADFFQRYRKATEHIAKNTAEDAAETIFEAYGDKTGQLRFISGGDARFYIDLKYKNTDAALMAKIQHLFFQTETK